jgi:hypothetical protein
MKDKAGTHLPAYALPLTAVQKHTGITARIDPNVENITGMEEDFIN